LLTENSITEWQGKRNDSILRLSNRWRLGLTNTVFSTELKRDTIGGAKSSTLFFALALQQMEDYICKPVHEMFDFLGGSLSASLITLGLTLPSAGTNRPRFSASDIIDILEDVRKLCYLLKEYRVHISIYHQEHRVLFPTSSAKSTHFQRGQLDELLKSTFGNANLSSCLTPTVLPAIIRRTTQRMEPWEAYSFQSWQVWINI